MREGTERAEQGQGEEKIDRLEQQGLVQSWWLQERSNNGLVKNGPGGRGKSNSYLLKTRRAEQVHGSHVTLLEARGRRNGKSSGKMNGLVEKRGTGSRGNRFWDWLKTGERNG